MYNIEFHGPQSCTGASLLCYAACQEPLRISESFLRLARRSIEIVGFQMNHGPFKSRGSKVGEAFFCINIALAFSSHEPDDSRVGKSTVPFQSGTIPITVFYKLLLHPSITRAPIQQIYFICFRTPKLYSNFTHNLGCFSIRLEQLLAFLSLFLYRVILIQQLFEKSFLVELTDQPVLNNIFRMVDQQVHHSLWDLISYRLSHNIKV